MKRWILSSTSSKYGTCEESWEGGGIDDVAFNERYKAGYSLIHSCQDKEDEGTYHYVFQKKSSKMLATCSMCGVKCSLDPEAFYVYSNEKIDLRVPPGTREALVPALLSPEGKIAGYGLVPKDPLATRARK